MKTLVFNTKEKNVRLYSDGTRLSEIFKIENTPTVKVAPEGFYEIFVKDPETGNGKPKVRIPINEVIMFIEE